MTLTTDLVLAFCSGTLAVFAVLGLAVRFVLLPYLRTHVTEPMVEVRDNVSNDHEVNFRDEVTGIDVKVDALIVAVTRLETTLTLTRAADEQTHRDTWAAINRLRDQRGRPSP